jgi:hypothetical protein
LSVTAGFLASQFEKAVEDFSARPALRDGSGALSYRDLWCESDALATAWKHEGLFDDGDFLALNIGEVRRWVPACLAAWRLGVSVVLVSEDTKVGRVTALEKLLEQRVFFPPLSSALVESQRDGSTCSIAGTRCQALALVDKDSLSGCIFDQESLWSHLGDLKEDLALETGTAVWCDPDLPPVYSLLVLSALRDGCQIICSRTPTDFEGDGNEVVWVTSRAAARRQPEPKLGSCLSRMYVAEGFVGPSLEPVAAAHLGIWGLTASGICFVERMAPAARKLGTVGRPVTGFAAKIERSKGQSPGPVLIRLPQEYHVDFLGGAVDAIDDHGWIGTGTAGELRSGFLSLSDG